MDSYFWVEDFVLEVPEIQPDLGTLKCFPDVFVEKYCTYVKPHGKVKKPCDAQFCNNGQLRSPENKWLADCEQCKGTSFLDIHVNSVQLISIFQLLNVSNAAVLPIHDISPQGHELAKHWNKVTNTVVSCFGFSEGNNAWLAVSNDWRIAR